MTPLLSESSAPHLNPSPLSAFLYFPLKAPLRAASRKATHPFLSQLLTGKPFYTFCSSFLQAAVEKSDSQALRTSSLLPSASVVNLHCVLPCGKFTSLSLEVTRQFWQHSQTVCMYSRGRGKSPI